MNPEDLQVVRSLLITLPRTLAQVAERSGLTLEEVEKAVEEIKKETRISQFLQSGNSVYHISEPPRHLFS